MRRLASQEITVSRNGLLVATQTACSKNSCSFEKRLTLILEKITVSQTIKCFYTNGSIRKLKVLQKGEKKI